MRILKLAVISLVIFFLLIFGLSLLIPSHIRISRAVNIYAKRDSVYKVVVDVKHWKKWNELLDKPELEKGIITDSAFISDKLKVHMQHASVDSVITAWTQENGNVIHSGYVMIPAGDTTIVQWFFDIYPRWYPWEKLSTVVLDNQLGPSMEKSLGKLKKEAEAY